MKAAIVRAALVCVSLALLAVPAYAAGVHFQSESLPAYERQLAHGEIHADSFHPASAGGHLHVSLNDGRHMTVAYAPSEQAKLVADARAKGVHVLLATATPRHATPAKHKLRYIAGGILIAVILIVLVVLLVGRRRAVTGGEPPAQQEQAGG